MISAFLVSVTLCIGTQFFNLNSAQRSIIHGIINLSMLHWVLLYPTLREFTQSTFGSSS